MAVDQSRSGYQLDCGRSLEEVWARLDEVQAGHADEHELGCAHCSTARGSLLALREATAELRADRTEPSLDLVDRIMSAVRANVRRSGAMVELRTDEPGRVEVSEQAVAAVLRYAADAFDGVRARRCRVRTAGRAPDGATLIDVELAVAVRYAAYEPAVLDRLRERVQVACTSRLGLRLNQLELIVDDIYDV
ncbi:hypothetical protein EV191_101865 [Tamaricihabitans halophyticus]|uniref:Uncharacterized protein n=1 Tax=Tamaricihabitans halophyticus TaxID=1262583 RepID=A0A4V2SV33_9PSEU|nr:Asp23/Gls24 family envelope stress response protein [Tamaricihabitans halophyticus]TCP56916.1 hypothetical protein EV191_101865 [Tamaricihabitans halophyticus]